MKRKNIHKKLPTLSETLEWFGEHKTSFSEIDDYIKYALESHQYSEHKKDNKFIVKCEEFRRDYLVMQRRIDIITDGIKDMDENATEDVIMDKLVDYLIRAKLFLKKAEKLIAKASII